MHARIHTGDQRTARGDITGRIRGAGVLLQATAAVLLALSAGLTAGCEDPIEKSRPTPEVSQAKVKPDLPEVPAFNIPARHPDGTLTVREMRLKSANMLETQVRVKGFVTWIYDCVSEQQGPEESAKDTRKRIDEDPTICQRPHFFIGDSADTSAERSIWVVDVPRKPRADELRTMGRQERAELKKPPEIELGDEVIVTGVWNRESPKGFAKSEGLMVYEDLENVASE